MGKQIFNRQHKFVLKCWLFLGVIGVWSDLWTVWKFVFWGKFNFEIFNLHYCVFGKNVSFRGGISSMHQTKLMGRNCMKKNLIKLHHTIQINITAKKLIQFNSIKCAIFSIIT